MCEVVRQNVFQLVTSRNVHCGEHWCSIYHSQDEHKKLIVEFILSGLEQNEKVVYLHDQNSPETILGYFTALNIDLQKYIKTGQLVFQHSSEVYWCKVDGVAESSLTPHSVLFDPDVTISRLHVALSDALEAGYSKLRVTGEADWASRFSLEQKLFEYENKLHTFFATKPCVALCQYDAKRFSPSCLLTVLTSHPKTVVGTEAYDNFYYIPPAAMCNANDTSEATLNHWIKNLAERKTLDVNLQQKAEELAKMNEALKKEIQEREEAQTQRQLAETISKAKSEFLATVSHEIRTPLNGILTTTHLLAETPLNEEQKEYVRIVEVSGEHLMTVLNDVLDFSKIESKKLILEEQGFSIQSCLKSVLDIFQKPAKAIHMNSFVDTDVPPIVVGDITRLRQVLVNLVSNAVKFTADDGHITINVSRHKPNDNEPLPEDSVELLFSVSDTGIGIPKEKQDFIFSAFSQVDSSCTRKYGGTGLGLAICQRIVEAMQGRIWVESEPNKGATFFFTIKTKTADEDELETKRNEPVLKRKASEADMTVGALRVLVAEDNTFNQIIIKKILEKLGHSVELVGDGQAAVSQVQNEDYDLIFMDLQMPNMGGLEATRAISRFDWHKRMRPKIVALTASAVEEDKVKCFQAGMDSYLLKPLSIDAVSQVCDSVKRFIAKKRSL
mmetsp:Transcript_14542/g.20267  ORF Transcript_14542/g.20267 Transcript_14542/m.20267 type:complete len:670 (+) Transcript_14542:105-2114(+)|eukprot:CAMPEP_0168554996 /NCGR_PEP_ID=MMETSP0413-20121227/8086_1 /TAXON_ID=136452 /ORGANISM="Filamoeba nolandi, Strain NC-AS-23-1" /LENGTH=669 /DNA_ID=CAMNT_0008585791 /DNA_START=37 /DNA_END=2046 /DNA_ORIENTATION=-